MENFSRNTNIARSEKAKKVLVIVDSKSDRKLIVDSLSHIEDMDFIEAEDGFDGLEKMNKQNISLFILDYKMPRMNGVELSAHIREKKEYKHIPIMMLTSEAKENMEAYRYGVSVYMMKPIKPIVLRKVVETVRYRYMGI